MEGVVEADAGAGFKEFLTALFGTTEAQAAGSWPYGTLTNSTPADCDRRVPRPNHFDLFDAMNVPWKGCVESRPFPLDLSEDAPTPANPDSYFVPYFWPDERDGNSTIRNDYLPDYAGGRPSWVRSHGNADLRRSWIWKYNSGVTPNTSPIIDLPYMVANRGPNLACPDPIVPLTGNRGTLLSAADNLMSYGASGTNIATGLVWAWRMLSPNFVPEARPYAPGHRKIVILMTDGFNDFVPQNNSWNRSDYSGTGYVERQRFGTRNRNQIMNILDQRTAEVCERIKGRDIELYTVLFDPQGYTDASNVEQLLRECATTPNRHVFRADSQQELVNAFRSIGNQINALRISR
ncbi:MAG: VWA domain-containing protein [Salinarimonas sp.]